MTPSLDSWTIIFLLAAAQGIFFSVVIFALKNKRTTSNYLIATLILLFSLNLVEYVAYWTDYRFLFPHLDNVTEGFIFLYGPFLYLYLKSESIKNFSISRKDLFHFVPFVLLVLYRVPYYLLSADQKVDVMAGSLDLYQSAFGIYLNYTVIVLKILHLACYSWLAYTVVGKLNSSVLRKKLTRINIAFSGFSIAFASYYLMVYTIGYDREYDYAISIAMSGFIYFIGYSSYKNNDFLRTADNGSKYEHSGLDEEASRILSERLVELMEKERLYLNRKLKLQQLADELGVPKYYVSQILNEEIGKTYSEFVNQYRIEEAKNLLRRESHNLNMHGIATEVGFNNKTTFNLAFKKMTGRTPSEYKEKALS